MQKIFLVVVGLALTLIVFWRGLFIPISSQLPVYEGLRDISGIIFGVMGVWLAFLYPSAFEKLYKNRETLTKEEDEKIKKLFGPFATSTVVLIFTILMPLLHPLLRTFEWTPLSVIFIRATSFATLSILSMVQIWTLILALVPADTMKRIIDKGNAANKRTSSLVGHTQVRQPPQAPEDSQG